MNVLAWIKKDFTNTREKIPILWDLREGAAMIYDNGSQPVPYDPLGSI